MCFAGAGSVPEGERRWSLRATDVRLRWVPRSAIQGPPVGKGYFRLVRWPNSPALALPCRPHYLHRAWRRSVPFQASEPKEA